VAFNAKALEAAAQGLKLTDNIESVNWDELATDEYLPDDSKGDLP
jgi:NitT/TauT family transport system substrate-binding protein